jgi:hypothetical protein
MSDKNFPAFISFVTLNGIVFYVNKTKKDKKTMIQLFKTAVTPETKKAEIFIMLFFSVQRSGSGQAALLL